MKALCASILSLVLLNSAMGQECVGCSLVCVATTPGAADCDICSPANCALLIENLDADCNTCLNSDDTGCDGRVLTETNLLVCETYCEFDAINDKCNLLSTMNAAYCDANCEISAALTDCENNCDNQDCLWTGNTVCECSCDCTTGVDECRAGDGCATDYICDDDAVENGRCACRLECGIDNGDACDLLNCPAECVANEDETACECAVVDCSNNTDCGGVDCTDTDQICDENLDEPPSGCICVPDCEAASQCDNHACDSGEECKLTDDKISCECMGLSTTAAEFPTSDGSVLHASATVCIVAALYSVSV